MIILSGGPRRLDVMVAVKMGFKLHQDVAFANSFDCHSLLLFSLID